MELNSETILNYLKEEVLENYVFNDVEIQDINRESLLKTDLGLDELDLLEITLDLEDKFDVLIDDNEISGMVNIGDMIDLILKERR